MALGVISMLAFFAQLSPDSTYVANVLPGLIILGVGMPCIFAPSFATATLGVDRYEAGVASAMVNTCQQVGGAVGTAVLSTIFANSASNYASSHKGSAGLASAAEVHGYTTAFYVATAMFAVGFLVASFVLPGRIQPQHQAAAEPVADPA
jgi:MFS family permease